MNTYFPLRLIKFSDSVLDTVLFEKVTLGVSGNSVQCSVVIVLIG